MSRTLDEAIQSPGRLKALQDTHLLDTPPERAFDRLTEMVCRLLKAPMALVSLVDASRQFFKSSQGFGERQKAPQETPLSHSFCKHVVQFEEPLVVTDSRNDPIVCDNPAIEAFNIQSYLGVPLRTPDGEVIGSLCALDNVVREWTDEDLKLISDLADMAMTEIAMRLYLQEQAQVREQVRLQADLLGVVEQAVIATDTAGRITFWNQFAETLYGWKADHVLGRNIVDVTPSTMSQSQAADLMSRLQKGESWSGEFFLRRKDGSEFWGEVTDTPILDAQGQMTGIIGVSHDASERRQFEAAIRTSEEFNRSVLESSADSIKVLALNGALISMNSAAMAHMEIERAAEYVGRYWPDMWPNEGFQAAQNALAEARAGRTSRFTAFRQTAKGTPKWWDVIVSPVRDAEGEVVRLMSIARDITEYKRANDRLAHLQQATAALSQRIEPDQIIQLIVAEGMGMLNAHAGSLYLFADDYTSIHQQASNNYPADVNADYQSFPVSRALSSVEVAERGKPLRFEKSEALAQRYALLNNLMERLHSLSTVIAPLIVEDRVMGMLVLHFDTVHHISESDEDFLMALASQCSQALERAKVVAAEKRARLDLEQLNAELEQRVAQRTAQFKSSRDQLRALAARLQDAREEERKRISREVHDVIGQYMTALKMSVSMLGRRLEKEQSPTVSRIADINALLDDAIKSVRKVATELRPAILDDIGLVPALEWYLNDFSTRTNIVCEFKCAASHIPMDADRATALYRLVQEALTNVARHAQATRVQVELYEEEGILHTTIKDDGRGITVDELGGKKSLGLVGMLERVQVFDGELQITGAPGQGTLVSVTVPLNTPSPAHDTSSPSSDLDLLTNDSSEAE